jgi:hypothetical protein
MDFVDLINKPFNEEEMTNFYCDWVEDNIDNLKETYHVDLEKWHMDFEDIKPPKTSPFSGCANFSAPVSSSQSDATTPRIIEDVYGYNEPIDVYLLDESDPQETVRLEAGMTKMMKWDIEAHEDLRDNMWYFIENAVWSGNGFMYTFMDMEKEWIEEEFDVIRIDGEVQVDESGNYVPVIPDVLDALDLEGVEYEVGTVIEKSWKWKRYNPTSICVKNENVVWNEDAESLEDAFETGFVALKIHKTLDQIYRMLKQDEDNENAALYDNLTKVALDEKARSVFKQTTDKLDIKAKREILTARDYKTKKMEFHLVFGRHDVDNDNLEEQVVMLMHIPSKTLLGWEKFQYDHGMCPIVSGCIKPRHKKVIGKGIPEMLYDIKGYLDSSWNQRIDYRTQQINPPLAYTKRSGFKPEIHRRGHNQKWELDYIDDSNLRYFWAPSIDSSVFRDEEMMERYTQNRTGASNTVMGAPDDKNQTFRGIITLLEQTDKFRGGFKRWISQATQKIFYQRYRLYRQYWVGEAGEDDQVNEFVTTVIDSPANSIGQDGLDALNHNFNITMKATNEDKKIKLMQTREKYQLLMQEPLVAQSPSYRRDLLIEVLKSMGETEPEKDIPTEQEYEEYQYQLTLQAQRQIAEEQAQAEAEENQRQVFEEEFNKEQGREEVLEQLEGINV